MNFKGKNRKINPVYALYVLVGLLAAAVPVRMYQLLNIIESDTGFYDEKDWSVYLMYALGILAITVTYILITLAKNIPASKPPFRKNKFLAVSSFIFAVGIVLDVVSSFSSFILNFKSFTEAGIAVFATVNQGQLPLIIESVLGVFAAIYIFIFGISYLDGRTTYSQYKFLAVTPLFWAMSRIVTRFLRKISYVNVSDLMLELFAIAFMMIFLLAFARISSKLSNNKAMRTLFASGIVSSFFCVTANLPRLLMIVTGNMEGIPDEYPFSLSDLAFALFTVVYIVNAMRCAKENDSAELTKSTEKPTEQKMETDDNFLSE